MAGMHTIVTAQITRSEVPAAPHLVQSFKNIPMADNFKIKEIIIDTDVM
jgi:hypothetical protein